MVDERSGLTWQFPEYAEQIRTLARSSEGFNALANDYQSVSDEIHQLESSGDVGLEYEDLVARRAALQEELVVMMQEVAGR